MTGKMHMAAGMMAGMITVYYGQGMMPGICPLAAGAALGAAGGLLPDIDSRNSMAGHTFPLMSKLVCRITEHRGILHTTFAPVFMGLLLFWLYWEKILPGTGFVTAFTFPAGYLYKDRDRMAVSFIEKKIFADPDPLWQQI